MSEISDNPLRRGLKRYFSDSQLARLASSPVGIAGCGGIGSNAAMMLARSGVETMRLVDHDAVEHSNLNRQQYWPRHLGKLKTAALAEALLELNADMKIETVPARVDAGNLAKILSGVNIWIEALDDAESKKLFVEKAILSGRNVVSASGIAGFGGEPLRRKRLGKLILAGDFATGIDIAPPLAPRVTQAAALLADSVLELILGENRFAPR